MSEPFNEFGPFAVGEVCVFQNAEMFPEFNGLECVVMHTGVTCLSSRTLRVSIGYAIRFANGINGLAVDNQLRRRKPPTEYKGEAIIAALILKLSGPVPQRAKEMA